MRRRFDFRDPEVQLSLLYFFDFHEQLQSLLAARLRLSQQQLLRPARAAYIAAVYPAEPSPPMTISTQPACMVVSFLETKLKHHSTHLGNARFHISGDLISTLLPVFA